MHGGGESSCRCWGPLVWGRPGGSRRRRRVRQPRYQRPHPPRESGWRHCHRTHCLGSLPGAQGLPVDRSGDYRPRGPRQQIRPGHRRQYEDGPIPCEARRAGTGPGLAQAPSAGRSDRVAITGRAAHGSKFDLGIDANMKMGQFLARLGGLERDLRSRKPHPLVGPPSLHAATLSGGTGLSTYAASSTVEIERRTIPGETEAQAVGEIQSIVDGLAAEDPDFHAAVRSFFVRNPFEVPPDARIVQAVDRAAEKVLGKPPAHIGDTPWMDAALLQEAGIETVVCGAAGAGAHSDVEWVDLESVVQLARILAEAAIDYCA